MYLEYCLIANIAICLLSIIIFYIMKKKNQTNMKNSVTLVFCTVLAMICASLTPLIAGYLVKGLSFSVTNSVIVTLVFVVAIALMLFYFILPKFIRLLEKNKEKSKEIRSDSIMEKIIEDSAQARTTVNEVAVQNSDNVKTNEAAITIVAEDVKEIEPSSADIEQEETEKAFGILPTDKPEENKQQISENKEYNEPVIIDTPIYYTDKQSDISELLDRAAESKTNHNYQDAITAYESALILNPHDELRFLIILDLCSLYKLTKNSESIYKLLDSAQCNLLNESKKQEILRNIKIS